jgi:hypothetical protein
MVEDCVVMMIPEDTEALETAMVGVAVPGSILPCLVTVSAILSNTLSLEWKLATLSAPSGYTHIYRHTHRGVLKITYYMSVFVFI